VVINSSEKLVNILPDYTAKRPRRQPALDSTGSEYGPMAACCKRDNKFSDSTKGIEFHYYQLLKKDFVL
jgi:hypothetical protein